MAAGPLAEARMARMVEGLRRLRDNLPLYSAETLKIKDKSGALIPFRFNRAQTYLHERLEDQRRRTGRVRAIVGKGRQGGISTYIGARFFHRTTMWKGTECFILTHEQDATDNLFEMVERFHEHSPLKPSTSKDNAKELTFDRLDSGYSVGTAGTKARGRSKTVHLLHWCVAEGTLIVCNDGRLKPVEAFVPGDLVRTHRNVIAPVRVVSQRVKDCWRVLFRGLTSLPLVLSGEHRVWTWSGWSKIDDLGPGDAVGFPVREITQDVTHLPFRLAALRRSGNKPSGPDDVALGYDLGRIAGLYLAEGTVLRQWPVGFESGVTFSVHEDEADRTVEWLKPLANLHRSMKVAPSRTSKTVHITVYGKSIAVFLSRLVGTGDNKRLPDNWWTMGDDFVRGLVHGYLSGDGHFSPARSRIIEATSIRSAITVGMRDALASLGYGWAGIKHKPAGVRHGRVEREAWVLRLCGPGVERLSAECGKPFVARQRRNLGNHGDARIENGYAWIPIISKVAAGLKRVFDFEVGHDDHSYCTLHGATHNSEVAFSANAADHFAGVVQTVPGLPGTEVVLESTGNGPWGEFYERWQRAEAGIGDYEVTFVPWFWTEDYTRDVPDGFSLDGDETVYQGLHGLTLGQMVWRRAKMAELRDERLFKQEFPATATEMFEASGRMSFIPPELVIAARKNTLVEGYGPLVVGVDPARFGDDRFSVAWRKGRKVIRVESRLKIGTVEAIAWLKDIIDQHRPVKLFIDAGGGGDRIFDVMTAWGEPYESSMVLVNFGSAPLTEVLIQPDGTKRAGPVNRRAEMWMNFKEWLEQVGGASLPDLDGLQADAAAPGYTYRTTDQRLQLESKEQMRARGVRSPDEADAICLTFAEPVRDRPQRPPPPGQQIQVGGSEGAGLGWLAT